MKKLLVPAIGVLTAVLAACGSGSSTSTARSGASGAAKDVAIEMRDIAYSPTTLAVKKGDTVKFTFTNKGAIAHEALIGDDAAQATHAKEMSSAATDSMSSTGNAGASDSMGGMDHGGSGDVLTVDPGKSGTLSYSFDQAGTFIIGCHEPGHFEAGMKVAVTVS
ncbi:MAG: plastocyanin/azurin family copper-binding protein [Acidimicrobiales bacterium]